MPTPSRIPMAGARARLQAWCVGLLSIQCDAYGLGLALGEGIRYRGRSGAALKPAALLLPAGFEAALGTDFVDDAPVLAIELVDPLLPPSALIELIERYRLAGCLEAWFIPVGRPDRTQFFQRDGTGRFDRIGADRTGVYFSLLSETLFFPASWPVELPSLWKMMRHWEIIDADRDDVGEG